MAVYIHSVADSVRNALGHDEQNEYSMLWCWSLKRKIIHQWIDYVLNCWFVEAAGVIIAFKLVLK